MRDDRSHDELTLRLYVGDAPEASALRLLDGAEISLVPDESSLRLSISGPDGRYRLLVPQGFHIRTEALQEVETPDDGILLTGPGTYELDRES